MTWIPSAYDRDVLAQLVSITQSLSRIASVLEQKPARKPVRLIVEVGSPEPEENSMGALIQMTDQQKVAIGATLVDVDGKPFAALPAGVTVSFVSDRPDVAAVTVRPDGMNADVGSGSPGTATITVTVQGADIPPDTVTVVVTNSAPGSLNLTVGAPESE